MEISIIVPIYNTEKTLIKCLTSISQQTFRDFEVILIDDGSKDSSGIICDKFMSKDSRFKVIHKKNEGVATARKIGILHATGKYTIHIDSDDWVEPTMLEEIYKEAIMTKADIIITDYFIEQDSKQQLIPQKPLRLAPNDILINILEGKIFGSLWNKLIKTELYKKYNVQFFKNINYCEDVLTCAQILKHSEITISYLNKAFYHYTINQKSITHAFSRENYNMRLAFNNKLNEILSTKKFEKGIQISRLTTFAEGFMYKLLSKEEIKKEFKANEYAAFHYSTSIRWKIGYFLIKLKSYSLARFLIKY